MTFEEIEGIAMKILIVEDDVYIGNLIEELLKDKYKRLSGLFGK